MGERRGREKEGQGMNAPKKGRTPSHKKTKGLLWGRKRRGKVRRERGWVLGCKGGVGRGCRRKKGGGGGCARDGQGPRARRRAVM